MGHWFEIIALLVLALVVFGPKRMVEMGSQLGKAFRDFRETTKDMNFSQMFTGLTGDDDSTPANVTPITPITPVAPLTPNVVEGSIERPIVVPVESAKAVASDSRDASDPE